MANSCLILWMEQKRICNIHIDIAAGLEVIALVIQMITYVELELQG